MTALGIQLSANDITTIKSSFRGPVDDSSGGLTLMTRVGLGAATFPGKGGKRRRDVRSRRIRVLESLKNKPMLQRTIKKVFDASDPDIGGESPTDRELRIFHDLFASEASRQLNALGIATTQSEGDVVEYNRSQLESSIIDGANQTVVGPGTPATPLPDPSTLSFGSESIVGSLFDTPGPVIEEPTFGEHEPAPAPDLPSDEPATEPVAEATSTPEGELIVEQLQASMATSSELVSKAAEAVDASAKATTKLQETVKDTTDALKTLTEAQTQTETASPALSQQVLAQIQADPSLAKLVKEGLLKWDDLLGKNPEPGKEGHVAGVAVGDPVVLPKKLQQVIDNLQTARVRENASLTGAIEVNRAARTTTGFRPSDAGYYPGAQVWMPIRAPPASLPGRR
jgi:hypothetical protein